EAVQAELRAAENHVETLRAAQYRAGDALHEKQGAFYAANAEVTRLEQQLEFARESDTRIAQQVAQLTETIAALDAQRVTLSDERSAADTTLAQAIAERERAAVAEDESRAALPPLDDAVAVAAKAQEDL